MFLESGTTLEGGKYRIIKVLGQGGFGITYLAVNTVLEIQVAIKEFFPKEFCDRLSTSHVTLGTAGNRETVERLKKKFLKEARNLAQLNHEGIVRISDVFEENDTAYYVMDYIEGESLMEMVKSRGPLDEKTAVRYIREVGEALEYIHSEHMTHFDVKPSNVMINSRTGRAVLIDFGLSKQYGEDGIATSSILQGVSKGFSPLELYNSDTLDTFSPKTDLYSLAATLYYLLTGTIPPAASKIVEEGLQLPSNISPAIRDAITKAMSASRAGRHESIREFCSSLTSGSAGSASASSAQETTRVIGEVQAEDSRKKQEEPVAVIPKKKRTGLRIFMILLGLAFLGVLIWWIVDVNQHTGTSRTSYRSESTSQEAEPNAIDSTVIYEEADTLPLEESEQQEEETTDEEEIVAEPLKEKFFYGMDYFEENDLYSVNSSYGLNSTQEIRDNLNNAGYKFYSKSYVTKSVGWYPNVKDKAIEYIYKGDNVEITITTLEDDTPYEIELQYDNYSDMNDFLLDLSYNGWEKYEDANGLFYVSMDCTSAKVNGTKVILRYNDF